MGCPLGVLTVSLFTKEKAVARRRGAELTLVSEQVFEQVRDNRLTPAQAKAIVVGVARVHMAKLDLHAAFDRQRQQSEPMSGERADRIVGAVYRLLAERGRAAALDDGDGGFLAGCGLGPDEALQVNATLAVLRAQGLVPPPQWKLGRLLAQHAPEAASGAVVLAEAETAYYRGLAAACLKTEARWASTLDSDLALLDEARDAAPVKTASDRATAVRSPPRVAPSIRPAAEAEVASSSSGTSPAVDPEATDLTRLAEGLIALKTKKEEWTAKTGRQTRQTAALLMKVTDCRSLERLRQSDLALFADTLLLHLPKSYGRSCKDAAKSMAQLLAEASSLPAEGCGLDGATVNRHLTHLGNLLTYAAGRGLQPAEPISLAALRTRKKGRDRDKRPAISREQLELLLTSPIWRGSKSERDRLTAGDVVIHDALYWTTPIGAYGLMRREEICGLMVTDVIRDGSVPCFEVRPNKYPRLKNEQSCRSIPIHPELIRLGFLAYVEAVAALGCDLVFPELQAARDDVPLGDQLYDEWRPALNAAVPGASEAGVVFHSLRHYGNHALIAAKVQLEWRQDILGHGGRSEAEERYRSEADLKRKLTVLRKLPLVTADLKRSPINLRSSVVAKVGRRSRRTS